MGLKGLVGVICLGLLMVASGCKSKKDLTTSPVEVPRALNEMYDALLAGQPDYTWFNARARMKAETPDGSVGLQVSLRMIKDSVIWMKAEKFGFELGRALVSPDSIWLVDRLNKVYYQMTLEEALAEYSAPFSFSELQSVLASGSVQVSEGKVLKPRDDRKNSLILENSNVTARYWFDDNMDIYRGLLTDHKGSRVEIENADFRMVMNEKLPFERYLSMFGPDENAMVRFQFAEIELDVPKSIAFAIPSHYLRMD